MDCSFRSLLIIAALFRLILIIYGEWQDAHMEVRYTDIDYIVFSDAASLVASGKSPYERSTYRYSPLLAYLLVPNVIIHRSWGKLLFSAADLLVGFFVHSILKKRKVPEDLNYYCVAAWLFNPFTFTIGTRGNCEPIVCATILWIIICLMNGNLFQAAFWYGLIVHFRIYPIIYSLPILVVLDQNEFQLAHTPLITKWTLEQRLSSQKGATAASYQDPVYRRYLCFPWQIFQNLMTKERLLFGSISASVFFFWTALFFSLYGWEFLNEAFLYHLTRTDPRHNFSIYFYHIYLHHQLEFSVLERLISFLPQLVVQLVLVFRFGKDLPFCFFVQTVAFVAFNKVITAQYFVWFFCLLPVILPWSNMRIKWRGLLCMVSWMGVQIHWLLWGYLLEFKGKNVFIQLWLASILFLAANTLVLVAIIRNHRFSPIFVTSGQRGIADEKKVR
ncbi:hypothetical protein H6P81_008516 [Aristolochia fimbriata]|uniref:GPI mannosyltransferase 1 n=1 Tax=Aristolochia fimbriata TaxID=158543 RepID=A0AAV7EJF3_ARIFI|nr:hypothetical protein H6P81_008516 [Aristolochia fimbriata]